MELVVTGASGVLGQALLRALVARGALASGVPGGPVAVRRIIAVDRAQPATLFLDARIEYVRGDYEQPRFLARMMGTSTGSVFHLSGLGVALDLERVPGSLDAAFTRSVDTLHALLGACAFQAAVPRLVLASASAPAADGGQGDALAAACELLAGEAARYGIVDARCVRLPCVVGSGLSAEGRAVDAQLGAFAAGQVPGSELSAVDVLLPNEAAAALIEAHERARAPLVPVQAIDVPGRRVTLASLAGAARAE